MLQTIADVLKGIADFIVSLVDFVISFIGDIVYIIKLTAEAVAKIPEYFSWLPSACVTLIVSIFAVVVIYKVLGREG